jgi:hypothetical protein
LLALALAVRRAFNAELFISISFRKIRTLLFITGSRNSRNARNNK